MDFAHKVSVIIPTNHGLVDLQSIVQAVCSQTIKPAEIVIIDSSTGTHDECPSQIVRLCHFSSIHLLYFRITLAFPGAARNIGIDKATAEFIAFIDVQTIPKPQWLEVSLNMLANHEFAGVWGATCFSAKTNFERLVRDGIYGASPQKTLPGSVFRREVFNKTGQFIEWVRAGEDTEWLLRLEVLKTPMTLSSASLVDYRGLIGLDLKKLLLKWHRNYIASRELPHFFPQRLLLWLFMYPIIVLIAFNWNYLIADWRMDSPFYIGYVTRIAAILPLLLYFFIRGFVLPLKRGVDIDKLLPTRFLAIALVCFLADLVKITIFSLPKRRNLISAIKKRLIFKN